MARKYLLGIDQGTSSSRAVIFDLDTRVVGSAQQEFAQVYPQAGWVEHDPDAIWQSVLAVLHAALKEVGIRGSDVLACGITNQRETTVVWDRHSGEPVYNAIVWQDRRTAAVCEKLRRAGHEPTVSARTGLRLDPYFSATKIAWILDHVDGARVRAERGDLAFGTIDSFLIWRLTGGDVHATDVSNASRTLLYDLHRQEWSGEMLELFGIPRSMLPDVRDCADAYGNMRAEFAGDEIAISGVAGDQQAALIGQAGTQPGTIKSTYGTGCFVLANTGSDALPSTNQLLTTVASRINGKIHYGLEGSVFVAGSAVQWLRDELGIVEKASDTEAIAEQVGIVRDVHVVPAFAGLGAPYWDADARGAILGLTRGSGRNSIITATLQAVAYQTADLIRAMADDGIDPAVIRVDGGMVGNNWFLQFLADVLGVTVERPVNIESTVLGAVYLAALQSGVVSSLKQLTDFWQRDRLFEPRMSADERRDLLAGWASAVARVRSIHVDVSGVRDVAST